MDYPSRFPSDRRVSYRDDYSSRSSGYSDFPRGTPRTTTRRAYVDDDYEQRFERPPPAYREGRGREYDSLSGSKRPYSEMVCRLNTVGYFDFCNILDLHKMYSLHSILLVTFGIDTPIKKAIINMAILPHYPCQLMLV